MPVTIADILDAQATIETPVSVGDKTLTVRWHPGGLTGQTEDIVESDHALDEDASPDERSKVDRQRNRALRAVLGDLIAGWDLVDEKGRQLPVAPTLAKLPGPFLWALFNAMSNESAPKEASEPASSAT